MYIYIYNNNHNHKLGGTMRAERSAMKSLPREPGQALPRERSARHRAESGRGRFRTGNGPISTQRLASLKSAYHDSSFRWIKVTAVVSWPWQIESWHTCVRRLLHRPCICHAATRVGMSRPVSTLRSVSKVHVLFLSSRPWGFEFLHACIS